MFELYTVPSLVYCVDSIMSFYHNNKPSNGQFMADGLVISFNTASTSIIPILNGKGILGNAKRYIICASAFGQPFNNRPLQDPMGLVTGHRVSPEVDTAKVSNIPYSRHILTSERTSDLLSGRVPGSYGYISGCFRPSVNSPAITPPFCALSVIQLR